MNGTTVWQIGDTVYGVHEEVENRVYKVYVIKERIVCFHDKGGWQSEGKINSVTVHSEMIKNAYDTRETAVREADMLAALASEKIISAGAWDKVEKIYDN